MSVFRDAILLHITFFFTFRHAHGLCPTNRLTGFTPLKGRAHEGPVSQCLKTGTLYGRIMVTRWRDFMNSSELHSIEMSLTKKLKNIQDEVLCIFHNYIDHYRSPGISISFRLCL